jgi:predicted phosphodiesterase
MKIQPLSDLHLEFAPFDIPPTDAALIVLAGDIATGSDGIEWAKAWSEKLGKPIVYVLGNHEYYGHAFPDLAAECRRACDDSHISLLENEAITVGDVRILGCTLWTDFRLFGSDYEEECMGTAEAQMMDYRAIKVRGGKKLRPRDTRQWHKRSRAWLEAELRKPWHGKTVVVTHHGAYRGVSHPHYHDSGSAAFVSDLRALLARFSIDLWISGHTHASVDTELSGVRFISNQRGYPGEQVPGGFKPDLVVTL